jgi:hypothetical protein
MSVSDEGRMADDPGRRPPIRMQQPAVPALLSVLVFGSLYFFTVAERERARQERRNGETGRPPREERDPAGRFARGA